MSIKNWESTICETNKINIHYTRTGGDKPPIILLHGLMTSGLSCWMDLAHALEKEYDVIMPDARGHGYSSVPDFGYRYEDHANDVEGLIKTLNLHYPIIIGHSMGGMTAALVANRKPQLLKGVILVDPTFLSPKVQREVCDSDVADQHRQKLKMSLNELLKERLSKKSNRSEDAHLLFAKARLQTSMAAFDVLTPPNPDYKNLINTIGIPSLIIFGDKGVITCDIAEELQQINPQLQATQIPKSGHSVHLDQPVQFTNKVLSFVNSII